MSENNLFFILNVFLNNHMFEKESVGKNVKHLNFPVGEAFNEISVGDF